MSEPSDGALIQLVADQRRREVIQHLRHEANGRTTIDDLVNRMHNGESQPPDREQLAVELYHVHLPRLADHGVVDFDPKNRTVRYQRDEQFETVLDILPDELSVANS